MQGSKYQRRWFELTSDTLTYAKDRKELTDGDGDIEVFAVHELKYVKKLEDEKLEVGTAAFQQHARQPIYIHRLQAMKAVKITMLCPPCR